MTLTGLLLSLRRGDFVDKATGEHIQFCHLKLARPSDEADLIGLEDEKVKVEFSRFEQFKALCSPLIGKQVEVDVDMRIKGKFVKLTALTVRPLLRSFVLLHSRGCLVADFNYSLLPVSLPPEDISFLEDCAHGVESGLKITVEGILEIGRALCAARDKFGGNDKAFGRWREGRLPWLNSKTCLRFTQVFERFNSDNLLGHNVLLEILPTVLYALAAPSTPDSVVTDITARVQAGEKVKVKDVKQSIQKAKAKVISFPNQDKKPASKTLDLSQLQSHFQSCDLAKLLPPDSGITKEWLNNYYPLYLHLSSLYERDIKAHDSLLAEKFALSIPPDTDLTPIFNLADFLVKVIAHLPTIENRGKSDVKR